MLEKIETKEIMTMQEAMTKYNTKYFIMIITEQVNMYSFDNLGYVTYTADTLKEMSKAPKEDLSNKMVAFMEGALANEDRIYAK